jgi:hypothetical protein
MKKLATALMVVALMGGMQKKAFAWKKCEFDIAMHIGFEKANTSCLWGMFKSGPKPCPPEFYGMDPVFEHGGFGDLGYAAAFGATGMKAQTAVAWNPAPAYGYGYGYAAPSAVAWNYAPAYGYGYPGYAAPAAMAWMPVHAYGYGYPAYYPPATAVAAKPAPAPVTQPVGYFPNYNAAYFYPVTYYYYPQWTGYAGW